jgi:hypothetical protein
LLHLSKDQYQQQQQRQLSGARVPVQWLDNGQSCLVLVEHITSQNVSIKPFPPNNIGSKTLKDYALYWQQHALIQGLNSSGRSIVNFATIFGRNVPLRVLYWTEEDRGYKAKSIDTDSLTLSLEILVLHVQFILSGPYSPILYGEKHLSPLSYIRKARRNSWF